MFFLELKIAIFEFSFFFLSEIGGLLNNSVKFFAVSLRSVGRGAVFVGGSSFGRVKEVPQCWSVVDPLYDCLTAWEGGPDSPILPSYRTLTRTCVVAFRITNRCNPNNRLGSLNPAC